MYHIRIFFLLIFVLLVFSCKTETQKIDCTEMEYKARKDLKNGHLKYYHFGISNASQELTDLCKQNNVTLINLDCAPIKDSLCYNSVADSIFASLDSRFAL